MRKLLRAVMILLALLAVGGGLAFCCRANSVAAPQEDRPRLAVLLVFDQMRGDYMSRWQKQFGEGGFRRIFAEGTWFQNCHYPYAYTVTAAGHASMATGCSPYKHGIIGNSWYDRTRGKTVEAVDSDRHVQVPTLARREASADPLRRMQPSVADALMEQTGGKAKVVSLSIKDRSAILLAALRALVCLWLDGATGDFVTSSYYTERLPDWVSAFNKSRQVDQYFDKNWNRLRPDLDYVRLSGIDAFPFEGRGYKQGNTFPHPMNAGLKEPGRAYYSALANSPYGNELLLELAKRAIVAEKLGQDDVPDLLCLSCSSNDMVGHCWGPDSQEVLDVTLRSDQLVRDLLQFLDDKVGKGRYVVVICADHGVCPLPERRLAEGHKQAGRVSPKLLSTGALKHLNDTFAKGKKMPWIESTSGGTVYLNKGTIAELGLQQAAVERALADWLKQQKGIQTAYTRTELLQGPPKGDPIGEMVWRSFHPDRSGDVLPVLEPYHLLGGALVANKTGSYTTTHGSPHPYDTHVPLLVFGTRVQAGPRTERVTPQAAASILAASLGIEPPAGAEAPVPKDLLK